MDFVYISDFFYPEMMGGAEQNDHELLKLLVERGHTVEKKKSDDITIEYLQLNKDKKYIVSNFVFLFNSCRDFLIENCDYLLYTHDHQYLTTRDPSLFKDLDYKAPKEFLKNVKFYEKAKGVICQSALHAEVVYTNLELKNIYNVAGNLWSEEALNLLEQLSVTEKRKDNCSIMQSQIAHKNTDGAVQFCRNLGLNYELLMPKKHEDFLQDMSRNEIFVFFPKTLETLSRIVCEARMMNCKVKTNTNIGAASEPWFQLKGVELIDVMREKRNFIPSLVEKIFTSTSELDS